MGIFRLLHIQHRLDALEKQYDLVVEKLKQLRCIYAIEASAIVRFQLEKQIKQTQAELSLPLC